LYELCKIGNYDGWARPVIRSWNSITRFKKTTAAEYRLGRLRISNKHRRYIPVKRYYKEAYIKWWWVSEHVPFIVRAVVSLITGFKELWKYKKYSKYFHVKVYFWDFFSIYYGVRKRAPDEGIYVFYGYYWIKKRGYHRLWRKKDKERYSKLPYGFPADYSTDPLYKGFYKGLKIFFLIIFRTIFDWGTREFWLYIFKNSFRFLYRCIRFIFYIPLMIYNIFDYIFLQRLPQWIYKKVMKYWMPHRKKYFKVRWTLHCFFDIIKRPRAYFQTISAVGPYEYHNPYITDHVEEISYNLGFRKSRNKKYFGDKTDWSYISRILRPQIKKTRQRKFFVIWAKKKI
jgi:hypothetical protein